jgi:tetratricopeptide (TPR) repeat protein
VLWIHASSAARLEQSIRTNLDDLKVSGRADQGANVLQLLRGWLQDSKNGKWLLILDNVDDARYLLGPPSHPKQQGDLVLHERILDYFPASNHGSILVTSRTTDAASKVVGRSSIISVEQMGAEHAVELLRKKLDCDHTDDEALQLTKALDYMPLAVNQAAAYISHMSPRCSVGDYLEMLEESDRSKLSLLDLNNGDLRRDREATNSIISTWQISFEHIRAVRPSASNLLSLMSFFDRQSIPESALRRAPTPRVHDRKRPKKRWSSLLRILRTSKNEHAAPGQDLEDVPETATRSFDLDITLLRSYSFISSATPETFTMHSLVQLSTRKWLRARLEEETWKARFVSCLDAAFPDACEYENWRTCAALYPHVKAAQTLKPTDRYGTTTWACLLFKCAYYALLKGLEGDARNMASLSVDELVRTEGQESKMAYRSMLLLADITSFDSSSPTVGHLQTKLVAISQKIYGEDTVESAQCKGLLAVSYGRQGRLEDAEGMLIDVVATLMRLVGEEDPITLTNMNHLARICMFRKSYGKAADLAQRVFEIRRRTLGLEHPDTLTSMNNLAASSAGLGLHKQAESLCTQALDIQTKLLGPEHPHTLNSMANLARTFWHLKSYDKAISLSAEALEMQRKFLRPDRQDMLSNMNDLALMYYDQKSYRKAIELGSESYEISKRVFGPGHRDTLVRMEMLAQSLYAAGRRQSASDLMELCAARSLDGLGPTDPLTVERQQQAEECRKELVSLEQEDVRNDAGERARGSLDDAS